MINSALFPSKGNHWSHDHWKEVDCVKNGTTQHGLLDESTGIVYRNDLRDNPWVLRFKALVVIVGSVPYFVAEVGLSILMLLPKTIYYLAVCRVYEATLEKSATEILSDSAELLLGQVAQAITTVLTAPFYCLANMTSAAYMLYDPYNGAKLAGSYQDSNDEPIRFGTLKQIGVEADYETITKTSVATLLFDRLDIDLWPVEGSVVGREHWEEVDYGTKDKYEWSRYVDKSMLDATGSGDLPLYRKKTCFEASAVFTELFLCLPFYGIYTEAYNLIRTLPIITYTAGCILYESVTGEQIFKDGRKFKASDITNQINLSICNLIRTPVYVACMMLAIPYACVSSLNGRKIIAGYEKAWNRGRPLDQGYWFRYGPQKNGENWYEGGGYPSCQTTFYLAGCMQTLDPKENYATYQDGKIVSVNIACSGLMIPYLVEKEEVATAKWN